MVRPCNYLETLATLQGRRQAVLSSWGDPPNHVDQVGRQIEDKVSRRGTPVIRMQNCMY